MVLTQSINKQTISKLGIGAHFQKQKLRWDSFDKMNFVEFKIINLMRCRWVLLVIKLINNS